jgi:hypothetical protein
VDAGRLSVLTYAIKEHGFPHTAQAHEHGAFGRASDTRSLKRCSELGA